MSVLIPVFNREKLLRSALDSALAQTLESIEVIVCDNASTDGTWTVIEEYEALDRRVRGFRGESNVGPLGNWRRCVELARGDIASLLFSDDRWAPTFAERAWESLSDPGVGFAYASVMLERENGTVTTLYGELPAGVLPARRFVEEHLGGNDGRHVPCSPCCGMFRTPDLKAALRAEWPDPDGIGFAAHGAGPDLWVYLSIAARYPSFSHIPEPMVRFRDHGGVLSRGAATRLGYAAARQRFVDEYGDLGLVPKGYPVAQLSRLRRIGGGSPGDRLAGMVIPTPSRTARWAYEAGRGLRALGRRIGSIP